jgi:Flp pilus assembly protein TadD
LIGAVCGVYSGSLRGEFLFDDTATILNNPSILHLWPLVGSGGSGGPLNPSSDHPASARPLVNLSLAINYYFGGTKPFGYHAWNVAVHALTALLLWAVVWRTLRLSYFDGRFEEVAGFLSFAAALIWAMHPLDTESVAYVTQRTESMMGLCYLTALYASQRYWDAASRLSRGGWLIAATAAGILGMLSKEMMASAIGMVLLYERTFVRGSFREALRQSWPLYIGLALGFVPVVAINYHGPRTPLAGFHLGVPAYVWWLTQTEVVLMYLKLAVWPWPLVIHYEVPYLRTIGDALPWLAPVSLLIMATLVLVWRRTSLGYVLAWFFAVLSPTLLIPLPGETVAERRMYVPLMAMAAWVVVAGYTAIERVLRWNTKGVGSLWRNWSTSKHESIPAKDSRPLSAGVATVAAVALTVILGAVSVRRVAAYKDELTIWEDAVRYQPNDPLVQVNLGTSLGKAGRTQESKEHFEKALELDPKHSHAHYNLARTLAEEGQYDEAISHYEAAVRTEMGFADAEYNFGLALASVGRTSEAIEHFQKAIASRPDFAAAHNNLGVTLAGLGRIAEAIPHLEQTVKLEPDPESCGNLAFAYALAGRRAEAIAAGEKAIELARQRGKTRFADELEVWLAAYRVRGQ